MGLAGVETGEILYRIGAAAAAGPGGIERGLSTRVLGVKGCAVFEQVTDDFRVATPRDGCVATLNG